MFGLFRKLITGDLTTVFISIMLGLILLMIIPNTMKIAHMFGYQSKEEITAQRDQAVNANKVQDSTITVLEGTADNVQTSIVNTAAKVETVKTKIDSLNLKRTDTLKIIKESKATPQVKATEISETQIKAVWAAYCQFNSDDSCNDNVASEADVDVPSGILVSDLSTHIKNQLQEPILIA